MTIKKNDRFTLFKDMFYCVIKNLRDNKIGFKKLFIVIGFWKRIWCFVSTIAEICIFYTFEVCPILYHIRVYILIRYQLTDAQSLNLYTWSLSNILCANIYVFCSIIIHLLFNQLTYHVDPKIIFANQLILIIGLAIIFLTKTDWGGKVRFLDHVPGSYYTD